MVRSLVLIVAVIALVYGCTQALGRDTETPVDTIDYSARLASAEELADFDVLAPRGLPQGWRATSADVERSGDVVAWHLGFLNPDDRYVGLEQTDGELDEAVAEQIGTGATGETVEVAGRRWTVYRSDGGDNALVHIEEGVTTVVNGSPDVAVLREFARSLR